MRAKFVQVALIILGLGVFAMAGPVTLTFDSGGGNSPGGTYYYPYTITVSSLGNLTVACDDFVDHVDSGETFTAWQSTYADLSHALYNNGQQAPSMQYDELAYLFTQLQPTPPLNNTQNAALNYAMWELFDPSAINTDPTTGNSGVDSSQYWLTQAASYNYANFDTSRFVIFSPIPGDTAGWTAGQPQEFIGEVPEPATLALLGTGLLFLAFLFRRRLHDGIGPDASELDLQA